MTIRERLQYRPSLAVKAMLEGIKEMSQADDFQFRFQTFGSVTQGKKGLICCGCAATCAVQKIYGKRYSPDQFLEGSPFKVPGAITFDWSELKDIELFETAVDTLRRGFVRDLVEYFYGEFDIAENEKFISKAYSLNIKHDFEGLTNPNNLHKPYFNDVIKLLEEFEADLEKKGLIKLYIA